MTELVNSNNSTVEYSREQIDLLKRTVCKGSTDDEFQLFAHVCKKSKLDPFAKQIHAVKRWSKAEGREVMSIQVGIDGYRLIAHRTNVCAGISDPSFTYRLNPETGEPTLQIESASVIVKKIVGGHVCEFKATAFWSEYYPGEKMGYMWRQRPKGQLGKCAEALALRKAFPSELSGLYTNEEMDKTEVESEIIEEVITKPAINYSEQVDQIDHIKNLLAKKCEGLSIQEKGQVMVTNLGISKFEELGKKTNSQLDNIISLLEKVA